MKLIVTFVFALAALASVETLLYNGQAISNHVQHSIRAGKIPVRGVNLGNWMVTEYWINTTDPMWTGVPADIGNQGEMRVMNYLGHARGDPIYQNHWATFITEDDIREMASYQLNAVRVPVGWWILGYDNNDPSNLQEWKQFAPGGLAFLDQLINVWASKYNISVLVDIHGAKGSQNGMDHSAPPVPGTVYWDGYQENIDNSVEVARFMADRYRNSEAFLGVELLNEPNGVDIAKLKNYYTTAYNAIRATGNDCIVVISPLLTQQGPNTAGNWENFMPPSMFTNVWLDWHKYLLWGFEGITDPNYFINQGTALIRNDMQTWSGNDGGPLLMGEWCLDSYADFTDDQMKQYAVNLFAVMNTAEGGWTFWTWKQGNGGPRGQGEGGWSLRDLLRDGIVTPSLWI